MSGVLLPAGHLSNCLWKFCFEAVSLNIVSALVNSAARFNRALRPFCGVSFDKPVEECVSYWLFFVPTCLLIRWYKWYQISVPVRAIKWNVMLFLFGFLSTLLYILLLFVPVMKLCIFKTYKSQFLWFLPCFVSTRGKWLLILVLFKSALNCFVVKVIMIEEGIS